MLTRHATKQVHARVEADGLLAGNAARIQHPISRYNWGCDPKTVA